MVVTRIRYNNQICVVRSIVDNSIIISAYLDGVEVSTGNPQVRYDEIPQNEVFNPLPLSGNLVRGELYRYRGRNVMLLKDHNMDEYAHVEMSSLFATNMQEMRNKI